MNAITEVLFQWCTENKNEDLRNLDICFLEVKEKQQQQ